jgi:hypothetical protein
VWNADVVGEVVTNHAYTLAQNVIIDLIYGAVDGRGSRPGDWRGVAAVRSESTGRSLRPEGSTAAGVARAENIRVGLTVQIVYLGTYCVGLRVEQHNQE